MDFLGAQFSNSIGRFHRARLVLANRLANTFTSNFREDIFLFLALRWLVFGGVILRFAFHASEYSGWLSTTLLLSLSVLAIYTMGLSYFEIGVFQSLFKNTSESRDYGTFRTHFYVFQVFVDIVLFSVLYLLTGRASSDFFLFYFLPLLASAQYLGVLGASLTFVAVTIAFGTVVTILSVPELPFLVAAARIWLPRWTFFLAVLFIVSIQGNLAQRRRRELELLYRTGLTILERNSLGQRLETIVDAAVELLNARGGFVYLPVPNEKKLRVQVTHGIDSEVFRPGYTLNYGEGMAGRIMNSRLPMIVNNYTEWEHRSEELAGIFTAVLEVPLLIENKAIGVLGVFDNSDIRYFNSQDIPTLRRLAHQAAFAVMNSSLFERQQALHQAGLDIVQESDLQYRYSAIIRNACELLRAKGAGLYILNPERNELRLVDIVGIDDDRLQPGYLFNIQDGIVGSAIRDKIPVLSSEHTFGKGEFEVFTDVCSNTIAVPIFVYEEVLGVLSVFDDNEERTFAGEAEQSILNLFAQQAAFAIKNARLLAKEKEYREKAETLTQISYAISGAFRIEEVGKTIIEQLRKVIEYDRATMQAIRDGKRTLIACNFEENKIDDWLLRPIENDALVRKILYVEKKTRVLPNPETEDDWEVHATTEDVKSWVGIPLFYDSRPVGFITLDHTQPGFYQPEIAELLKPFASHASIAVQKALLIEEFSMQVTQLTVTKNQLEDALNRLEEANNLAMIGLIYGEDIHLSNNRLGAAHQYAKNIATSSEVPDRLRQQARRIQTNIDDFVSLIWKMRQTIQPPYPVKVDIHSSLEKVINGLSISPDIKVRRQYNARNPLVIGLDRQLRQVFRVILYNSLSAMETGKGILTIKTNDIIANDFEYLLVSISDTGGGIPEDIQPYIFEVMPSKRIKRSFGFGLAWSRAFLRWYGGDLWFKSQLGQGTIMNVRIPRDFRTPEGAQ